MFEVTGSGAPRAKFAKLTLTEWQRADLQSSVQLETVKWRTPSLLSLNHVIYSPHGLSALSELSLLRPSLIRQLTFDLPPVISGRSFTAFEKSARSGYSGAF